MPVSKTLLIGVLAASAAAGQNYSKSTHTYKTVGDLPIALDVYRSQGDKVRPAIFWIHGGALIFGHRGNLSPRQLQRYIDAGFAVVSIDYRLAPETKLPQIAGDVCDAWLWLQDNAAGLGIDKRRVALVGHSAGGYLSLLTASTCAGAARAVVSFYGYGDISARWYAEPAPTYTRQKAVSESEARATVGTAPLTGTPMAHQRFKYYTFLRQKGLWVNEVAGMDPGSTDVRKFCPIRNLTASFPPSLLLHGDADEDVPVEQSIEMAAELKRRGVEHELIIIPNGRHGFDAKMDDPTVGKAFDAVIAFLARRLQ